MAIELYKLGGIRACEIGSVMFGHYDEEGKFVPAPMELVRLAIPRRVYTQSHLDYAAEGMINLYNNRDNIKGLKFVFEPKVLRFFQALSVFT